MGKRIVINTYGSSGDLNPFLAIGRALQALGHHVVIATDDFSRVYVESADLEFYTVRRSFLYANEMTTANNLQSYNIGNSYCDLLAAVRWADLLITHQFAFAGSIVAARTGIHWVSVALYPFTLASDYEQLLFGTSPSNHPVIATAYKLNLNLTRQWSRYLTKEAQWLRKKLDLPPGKNILFEDHHSPDLILALFSSVFATRQSGWPPQTRITGFPFDDELISGGGLPHKLARFLDDGPPPIVFTLGSDSIYDTGSFYVESVVAANLLGRRAILLGPGIPSHTLPNNANVISVEYAPYGELFSRAAAVVHHGGIGTIALAMRAGRPMLMLPGFAIDQPDNAVRATNLGVARMLTRYEYNAFSAAAELAHLLNDPSYVEKAVEIRRVVRSEDGVGAACDEIQQYLNRGDGQKFITSPLACKPKATAASNRLGLPLQRHSNPRPRNNSGKSGP